MRPIPLSYSDPRFTAFPQTGMGKGQTPHDISAWALAEQLYNRFLATVLQRAGAGLKTVRWILEQAEQGHGYSC